MLLTPAALWLVKGRLFRAPPILALKNPGWTTVFRWQRKSAQALFMLFMTMPTIAETIAPDTPPALPPIAPAMSWMIRLIIVPDMGFPPLWPQNHMDDTAINRPEIDRLASFLLCSGHKSIIAL